MPHQDDDADDVFKLDLDLSQIDKSSIQFPSERLPGDEPEFACVAMTVMTDVQIKQPGRIRVRAIRDGEIIKCGILVVKGAEQTETQTPTDA